MLAFGTHPGHMRRSCVDVLADNSSWSLNQEPASPTWHMSEEVFEVTPATALCHCNYVRDPSILQRKYPWLLTFNHQHILVVPASEHMQHPITSLSLLWSKFQSSLSGIGAIVPMASLLCPHLHMSVHCRSDPAIMQPHHVTPFLKMPNGSSFHSQPVPKSLQWIAGCTCMTRPLLPLPPHLLQFSPLVHSSSAWLAHLLIFHPPALEPLHLLFPPPARLFLQSSTRLMPAPP